MEVHCRACDARRRMAEAFGRDNEINMPACKGRRPHLRDHSPNGCDVLHVRPILQGASNSWFPIIVSAMSVPQATDKLGQLVEDNWAVLEKAASKEIVAAFRSIGQLKDFAKYTDAEVWEAIEKKRSGGGQQQREPTDLKSPEWAVFSNPASAQESKDFQPPGRRSARGVRGVLRADRAGREAAGGEGTGRVHPDRVATGLRLGRRASEGEACAAGPSAGPTWVPACETRGEGIFFQFRESAVQAWLDRTTTIRAGGEFQGAHERWRATKNLPTRSKGYPGMRYVLLHSFAHALIRQLSIECGYTTASVAERLYSQDGSDGEPMAGVLIYTAAPD